MANNHEKKKKVEEEKGKRETRTTKNILKQYYVIRKRWQILQKLGGGGYGQIYRAYDRELKTEVAVKVESGQSRKKVLRMEVAVIRQMQGKSRFVQFYGCGTEKDGDETKFEYLVMELLYRNIADLRRSSPLQRFSKSTTLRMSIQALEGIKEVHKKGFIHRDIKPSNFAMGYTADRIRTVIIIDFGLCRKHLDKRGRVKKMRKNPGFRGTVRYASPQTHRHQDQGRGDDICSLLYMMVEMFQGTLPWRNLKNKKEVLKLKETKIEELCANLPPQILIFQQNVFRLKYEDEPEYETLEGLLMSALWDTGEKQQQPFDWEVGYETVIREETEKTKSQHLQLL